MALVHLVARKCCICKKMLHLQENFWSAFARLRDYRIYHIKRAPGMQLGQVVIFKNLDDVTTAVTTAVTTCTHHGPWTRRAAGATPGTPASRVYLSIKSNTYYVEIFCYKNCSTVKFRAEQHSSIKQEIFLRMQHFLATKSKIFLPMQHFLANATFSCH